MNTLLIFALTACEPAALPLTVPDGDGDGRLASIDCDDADAAVGGPELPYDGVDNDCDPETADDDQDGDGWTFAEDCNDTRPWTREQVYNGHDDDCDPTTPDDDLDRDGRLAAEDCDDLDAARGGPEVPYDGIDQDCDRDTPDDDLDGDAMLVAEDCDDQHAQVAWSYTGPFEPTLCRDFCAAHVLGDVVVDPMAGSLGDYACVWSIAGDLRVEGAARLASLDGLGTLILAGDLRIRDNPRLADIDALAELAEVAGDVIVSGNPRIVDAMVLETLAAVPVGGKLFVMDNGG